MGQQDIRAGNFRDFDEFLDGLDGEGSDLLAVASFSAETFRGVR